jgi:hypothetical protein
MRWFNQWSQGQRFIFDAIDDSAGIGFREGPSRRSSEDLIQAPIFIDRIFDFLWAIEHSVASGQGGSGIQLLERGKAGLEWVATPFKPPSPRVGLDRGGDGMARQVPIGGNRDALRWLLAANHRPRDQRSWR